MTVREFSDSPAFKVLTGKSRLDREIDGLYVCDLLSWVMSHAKKGNIWITVLTHLNVVAVASLTEVSCVIIPENITMEESILKKADEEGIIILSTGLSSYEICCRACERGI